MDVWSLLQYSLFLLVVVLLVKPVGNYLARVFEGQKTFLDPALRPIENLIYRVARIDHAQEMDWKAYAVCFVLSGLVGTLFLYLIQRLQRLIGLTLVAAPPVPSIQCQQ